jgi:hypothetical protein
MLCWSLLFASVPAISDPHAAVVRNEAQRSKEFENRVEETANKIIESKKVPDSPALKLPPKPAGPITSDLDRWDEVWRQTSAQAAAIFPDYGKELSAAGFDELLLPDRFAADKDFTRSREIIEASQRAIKHARQRFKDLLTDVHQKVSDLHLGPEAAAQAQKSLEGTFDKMTGPMEEFFAAEEKIVNLLIEAARYLDFIRPHWVLVDHKVKYEREADMEHVRNLTQQIRDSRARQEEIKKEMATLLATIIEQDKDRQRGR